jgi:hypothetical protein
MFVKLMMRLELYGDDKSRTHLAPAGNFSGQHWQIVDLRDVTWGLTNSYSGSNMFLDFDVKVPFGWFGDPRGGGGGGY